LAGLGLGAPDALLAELGEEGVQAGGDHELDAGATAGGLVGAGGGADQVGEGLTPTLVRGPPVTGRFPRLGVGVGAGTGVGLDERAQLGAGDGVGEATEPQPRALGVGSHPERRGAFGLAFVAQRPVGVHQVPQVTGQPAQVLRAQPVGVLKEERFGASTQVVSLGVVGRGGQGPDQAGDHVCVGAGDVSGGQITTGRGQHHLRPGP
jgi:hypothetical protein